MQPARAARCTDVQLVAVAPVAGPATAPPWLAAAAAILVSDFQGTLKPNATEQQRLRLARTSTMTCGLVATAMAAYLASLNVTSLWDQFLKLIALIGGGFPGVFALGLLFAALTFMVKGPAGLAAAQQLARLMPKRFLTVSPWGPLQHFARYLKAITARLDKYRADPARDASRMAELRPLEQRYWRLVSERKGAVDTRMQEFRWLLEELRVSFFAQELRTPQPVSVKRLDKVWGQMVS